MKRRGFLKCLAAVPVAAVAKTNTVIDTIILTKHEHGETIWIVDPRRMKRKPILTNNIPTYENYYRAIKEKM